MFGKGKLAKEGATARAVVIEAKQIGGVSYSTGERAARQFDLTLRVHFDDGSTADAECRVGGFVTGTDQSFSEGDVVPVRYDPKDRAKIIIDEQAIRADRDARADTFKEARVRGAELKLSAAIADKQRTSAPTDSELQGLYDAWDVAMAKARAELDAHNEAKAAGDTAEANRRLHEGALANAEQVELGEQVKRFRALRPDWKPAKTQ